MGRIWGVWLVAAVLGCAAATDETELGGGRISHERVPPPTADDVGDDPASDDHAPPADDPPGHDPSAEEGDVPPDEDPSACIRPEDDRFDRQAVWAPPLRSTCEGLRPVLHPDVTLGATFGFTEPLACDAETPALPDLSRACEVIHRNASGAVILAPASPPQYVAPPPEPPSIPDDVPRWVNGYEVRMRFRCDGKPAWMEVRDAQGEVINRCPWHVDALGRVTHASSPPPSQPWTCTGSSYAYDEAGRVRAVTADHGLTAYSANSVFWYDASEQPFARRTDSYSYVEETECTEPVEDARVVTWSQVDHGPGTAVTVTERRIGDAGELLVWSTKWRQEAGAPIAEVPPHRSSMAVHYACAGGRILEEHDRDGDGDLDAFVTWTHSADGDVHEFHYEGDRLQWRVERHVVYRFDCSDDP